MIIAEYSKIAKCYDKNPVRLNQPKEKYIEELLKTQTGRINILDMACGTGNFIKAQQQYFKSSRLHWYGCDLSEEMLSIAKKKLKNVDLMIADAAKLPYSSNHFDYVSCNWAFQHFADKLSAIREIYRVLKPNGIFVMKNISPELMPLWWVFTLFPSSKKIDRRRFWSNKKLFTQFEKGGFKIEVKVEFSMNRRSFKEIYFDVKNRDISHLTMISESEYKSGLQKIKEKRNETFIDQFTKFEMIGRK
jgi:ubiquinone/menaquinone biosynthesis C-methylase UbiE